MPKQKAPAKPKAEIEKWGMYVSILLMFVFSGVFFPKRPLPKTDKQIIEEAEEMASAAELLAEMKNEVPNTSEKVDSTPRKIAMTSCGEKPMPQSLLRYPNPLLKSHVGEYEKESSSFLERSKLRSGISIVVIQDLCPSENIHFSLHFPEKGLIAKPPSESYLEYRKWVLDTFKELYKAKVLTRQGGSLIARVEEKLANASLTEFLSPSTADWGGVQITFKTQPD